MADELLFDSDRLELKARRKRRLILILTAVGILLIAVIIALIIRASNGETFQVGEDTLYPFTWQSNSDGSIRIEIPHENAPDYRWALNEGWEEYGVINAVREEKENDGSTCFTVTPTEEGRAQLELSLERAIGSERNDAAQEALEETAKAEEPEPGTEGGAGNGRISRPERDILYRMIIMVENEMDGGTMRCSVLSISGKRRQGYVEGGQESANPYRIFTNEAERLEVAITANVMESDWTYEFLSGEQAAALRAMEFHPGEMLFYLEGGTEPGEAELLLKSEAAAAEIRLQLVHGEDGCLLVTDHKAVYGEKTYDVPEGRQPIQQVELSTGSEESTETDAAAAEETSAH